MTQKFLFLLLSLTISKLSVAQLSKTFNLSSTAQLQYGGTSAEYKDEKLKLLIKNANYQKGTYSFSDNFRYEKKGTVKIPLGYLTYAQTMAKSIDAIIDRSEKFANNNSALWMSKLKMDSILKFNIYSEYETVTENEKDTSIVTTYNIKRTRQMVIVNGKAELIEALQLTTTMSNENIKGTISFTIQNNKQNPLLLHCQTSIAENKENAKEMLITDLWLKKVANVKVK